MSNLGSSRQRLYLNFGHWQFTFLVLTICTLFCGAQAKSNQPDSDSPTKSLVSDGNSDCSKPVADKWALVVGISKFQDSSLDLQYPDKDAKDFADYLVQKAHFEPDHVKLLTDEQATRERILDAFGDTWLPRVALPDDLVVIYISTHGSPASLDIGHVNYLIAHNTDRERLYSTGISVQEFTQLIKERVHCDRIVVIMDACHSGAAETAAKGVSRQHNFHVDDIVLGTGQLVICSSKPEQSSWEAKNDPNGVFTRQLIAGLELHGDKTKLDEAFQYAREKVMEQVSSERGELQEPVLKSAWKGNELVLAAEPTSPRPGLKYADQPTALQRATSAVASETQPTLIASSIGSGSKGQLAVYPDFAPWSVTYTEKGASISGKWIWDKATQEFTANWTGYSNKLKIETFTNTEVVITGTNAYGAVLKYSGVRNGRKVTGTGSWTYKDATGTVTSGHGDWQATW